MLKNKKGIGCGLVVLALLAGAFLIFGGLGGGGSDNIPQTGPGAQSGQGDLGQPYLARQIDRNGCPVETVNSFGTNEVIYVGYGQSVIPQGAQMFARLSFEGDPVEDTPAITADRDLRSCVWFQFEPDARGFLPGEYTADLIVNGNVTDQMRFSVSDSRTGTNTRSGAQLGRVTSASSVDNAGCPVDRATRFYPDEPIYVTAMESFIPAGTEVFARLIHEGDIVEDTNPIVANEDMQSCFWFVFEPAMGTQGFLPGGYQAEIYVNGNLADRVSFDVLE